MIINNKEKANNLVLKLLPEDQKERVFNQERCDIDPTFLGFMDVYVALARIIPKHFTVIDFGCAYSPQCFLFENHRSYIGVDLDTKQERFKTIQSIFYAMTIREYIEKYLHSLDLQKTFAICSYVPQWYDDNIKLVKENFLNVFTYYP